MTEEQVAVERELGRKAAVLIPKEAQLRVMKRLHRFCIVSLQSSALVLTLYYRIHLIISIHIILIRKK